MKKLKLMTILGTRPEIIRLAAVIKRADKYFDHLLVHTGQNYDYTLNKIFFEDLDLREPDFYLNCVGKDLGETMGNIISSSYKLMKEQKPDALLILGDTNSALSAISAKRLKIPIFHMEAGNRCWDWNVPEMVNRTIVDRISDINMPYTEHSRRYLISEGADPKTLFVTGSPLAEVMEMYKEKIEKSDVLTRLGLKKGKYVVVSAHREENVDDEERFFTLMGAINDVAKKYKVPVIFSTHPRTRKKIEERGFVFDKLVKNIEPLGYTDYNKLQKDSLLVLSDSGTLSEESAIEDFAGVLIRTSTERPEAVERGTVIQGGITSESILQAAEMAIEAAKSKEKGTLSDAYMAKDVSVRVVKIIQSLTDTVNETVWHKF